METLCYETDPTDEKFPGSRRFYPAGLRVERFCEASLRVQTRR